MKKITMIICLVSCLLLGDLAPAEGYHNVDRRVFITNIEAYPNIVLLGCVEVMGGEFRTYRIQSNESLEQGYKFNVFRFLGIEKNLLQELGDINATSYLDSHNIDNKEAELGSKLVNISIEKDSLGITLVSTAWHIEDTYPLQNDYYYYEINETDDTTLTLKLKRRELKFEDGSCKTISY